MALEVSFTINNRQTSVEVEPETTLLSLIRDHLSLTGTKEGCNEGECGACTVLIDGKPVDSCIYAAFAVEGRSVTTIEGVVDSEVGRALQAGFVEAGGVQCGFCTPGFVVTLSAFLDVNQAPSEDSVKHVLAGNICRCTGYSQIIDAVASVVGAEEST